MKSADERRLLARRKRLADSLPPVEEVLRGSVFERRRKCGKPRCSCTAGEGHLTVYLSVTLGPGASAQVTLSEEERRDAERLVANYDKVRRTLEGISEINRELLRCRRGGSRRTGVGKS
jgi:hypothetical protein